MVDVRVVLVRNDFANEQATSFRCIVRMWNTCGVEADLWESTDKSWEWGR